VSNTLPQSISAVKKYDLRYTTQMTKTAFFSTKPFEMDAILRANQSQHEFIFIADPLNETTAKQAANCKAVCCFVTDVLNEPVLTKLKTLGIQMIALRSAGYDHLDVAAAKRLGFIVARVPEYSPEAVAEFAVTLLLALTRKLPQALQKVARHDFTLTNLLGVNLFQKTIGIVGVGHIGTAFAKIMLGFSCRVLACDPKPSEKCRELPIQFVSLDKLLAESDVISLHCPCTPETTNIINTLNISKMKTGVILINTGRGTLIDTIAFIHGLETKKIGAAGLDVYAREKGLFFEDHSNEKLSDTEFLKLQTFPNVIITNHIAFFSAEAVDNIAKTTVKNLAEMKSNI